MFQDTERCLRAVLSNDRRFDGQFVTAVVTTGIYCRPSCPVGPPKPENTRFLPTTAAAQAAGFRACKRCHPDAAPGSPDWDTRSDVVGRALRLIADGLIERDGVDGLAARLGCSQGELRRQLAAALGAGPLAIARARRAQTARLLLETTAMPMADVAFAAGFGSVRQCNETTREIFGTTAAALRSRANPSAVARPGTVIVRLPFRSPLWHHSAFGHLVATAVPGVEEWRDGAYRRTVRLPHGNGILALAPNPDHVTCQLTLDDMRDVATAIARCRRLLDLDADPVAVDGFLAKDRTLRPLVKASPGRRIPRTVDEDELALRVVLGQQVSTAAARTHAGRLVVQCGEPISDPSGTLTHLFPPAAAVADIDPASLALPESRKRTFILLAQALAHGKVDLSVGADWADARAHLAEIPGVGPWTTGVIAMRALGDPDAFLAEDLGVRAAAVALGLPAPATALNRHAQRWRPWQSYAVQYLWGVGDHPINRLPADPA